MKLSDYRKKQGLWIQKKWHNTKEEVFDVLLLDLYLDYLIIIGCKNNELLQEISTQKTLYYIEDYNFDFEKIDSLYND